MPEHLIRHLSPGTDDDVAACYAALAERARDAVFGFEDEVAFLDVETTGFDPARDRIVEVAVLVARGPEVLERYETLVDPGRPIPREATRLTGIDDAAVAGAPGIEEVVRRVCELVGSRDVVAHNASFDRAFVTAAARAAGCRLRGAWLDSLQLSRIALPRLRTHRLRDLAEAFALGEPTHRAGADVDALFRLWRVLLCGLDALPAEIVSAVSHLAPETEWPLRRVLAHHAASRAAAPLDLKHLRRERVHRERLEAMRDADDCALTCPDEAEVLGQFDAEGAVGRMYPGFESRDEQLEMARAVLGAFAERRHLAVEAGTGVGKSVAYLVPAATFAMENRVGVGVATKTNALMDQLVHGELPALQRALGGKLRFVSLKGYEHYPCLRKLERLAARLTDAEEDAVATSAALLAWTAQSAWGDLDGVNVHWDRALRAEVACSVEDCAHKRCRFFPNLCYLHGARRRAGSAHIVVTNHALLFRDLVAEGVILPPLRHWVVDEAHAAESEARSQLSVGAHVVELRAVLRSLHARGRGGLADTIASRARSMLPGEACSAMEVLVGQFKEEAETAHTVGDSFFDFLKDLGQLAEASGYDRVEIRVTDQVRESSQWGQTARIGRSLAKRLEGVMDGGRKLVTLLEESGDALAEQRADLTSLLGRLRGLIDGLVTVLDGSEERYVYSVTTDRRPDVSVEGLFAAMLDVGEVLAEDFFPALQSVVFTSATIATGEDFGHFARAVGLDRLPEDAWSSLRLASSYDLESQMAVFVPLGIDEPGGRRYLDHMEQLLAEVHLSMGGSVLTLFTNRREMDELYRRLAPRLEARGLNLLVQGPGVSRKRLRDEFLADERLSLFATKSFWEGFDAPGDTLRCVVIAKLPFGPMNDPVLEERKERDQKWWEHHYLPEAIIELKQAAGRLIRSSTDTGCVIIADARLAGPKPYARRFLDALPVSDVEMLPVDTLTEEVRRRFGRA